MILFKYGEGDTLEKVLGVSGVDLTTIKIKSHFLIKQMTEQKSSETIKMLALKFGGMTVDEISLHVYFMIETFLKFVSDEAVMERAKKVITDEQSRRIVD